MQTVHVAPRGAQVAWNVYVSLLLCMTMFGRNYVNGRMLLTHIRSAVLGHNGPRVIAPILAYSSDYILQRLNVNMFSNVALKLHGTYT